MTENSPEPDPRQTPPNTEWVGDDDFEDNAWLDEALAKDAEHTREFRERMSPEKDLWPAGLMYPEDVERAASDDALEAKPETSPDEDSVDYTGAEWMRPAPWVTEAIKKADEEEAEHERLSRESPDLWPAGLMYPEDVERAASDDALEAKPETSPDEDTPGQDTDK